jgi:hypothetical protein
VTCQKDKQAIQDAEKEKAAKRAAHKKAREARVPFNDMNSVDYSALRQLDWFAIEGDEELDDTCFWCLNQKLIF